MKMEMRYCVFTMALIIFGSDPLAQAQGKQNLCVDIRSQSVKIKPKCSRNERALDLSAIKTDALQGDFSPKIVAVQSSKTDTLAARERVLYPGSQVLVTSRNGGTILHQAECPDGFLVAAGRCEFDPFPNMPYPSHFNLLPASIAQGGECGYQNDSDETITLTVKVTAICIQQP